jgi:hypothetical protein
VQVFNLHMHVKIVPQVANLRPRSRGRLIAIATATE